MAVSPKRNLILLSIALVVAMLATLFIAPYPQAGFHFSRGMLADAVMRAIVLDIRLPRILLAVVGGATLAAAGTTFQLLFANPLVEPGLLGVSQGASFGAALVIVLFGHAPATVQLSATIFGLGALGLAYLLARSFTFGGWILRLLLAGIAVGAFFSAALSIIKLVADPSTKLQDITFWMMGGLYNATWETILPVMPVAGVSLAVLSAFRWRMNILSLDDRTAHSIGLSPRREKTLLLCVATIGTTAIVSVSGIVSWIGLIIPHASRRLFGTDTRNSLSGSMVLGSLFMLVCDTLGRTLLAGEIPLGVLTSMIGTIAFTILLSAKRSGAGL